MLEFGHKNYYSLCHFHSRKWQLPPTTAAKLSTALAMKKTLPSLEDI